MIHVSQTSSGPVSIERVTLHALACAAEIICKSCMQALLPPGMLSNLQDGRLSSRAR